VLTVAPSTVNNEEGPANITSAINHAFCGEIDGKITIAAVQGGVSPYQYALNGGSFVPNKSFAGVAPGSHTIAVCDDRIGPIQNGCRVTDMQFRIYNRWGQLIYETSIPGAGWDGTLKGLPQPADTYVYTCSYSGADGVKRMLKGSFLLIR